MPLTNRQLAYIIDKRKASEKYASKITDPEKLAEFRRKEYERINVRRFYYVDRCIDFLSKIQHEQLRVINYTVFYNGLYYVSLDWAACHNLPRKCYWHDGGRSYLQLTPFGVNWMLDYLLHRNNVLVVRKNSTAQAINFNDIVNCR